MSKHRPIPSRRPRQVLVPGTRKAAVHPWARLLWAARHNAPERVLAQLRAEVGR